MNSWTPEQRWAIQSDRHTAITASAGSGKTAVLVERYVQLLLSGVMPQEIVAITFTRKAATEMYARIAAELERRIAAATTPQELSYLKPLRERLTEAPISTIHSFCAQLLRRFPIEAEVLPDFSELTEAEAERLRQEVALQVLEEVLEAREADVWALVRQYGQRETVRLLLIALRHIERLVFLEPVLRRPWQERMALGQRQLCTSFSERLGRFLERLYPSLVSVAELKGKRQQSWEIALQLCNRLRMLLPITTEAQMEEMLPLWQELGRQIVRQDGKPYAGLTLDDADSWRAEVRLLDQLVQAWQHRHEEGTLFQQMDVLTRLLGIVLERLEQEKRSRNVLDFTDLQIKALRLLEQPRILERLRREIRYLLVDEFQDTNLVQYALLQRLLDLGEGTGWAGPQLFVVGDPKQSIYGFRGAVVAVFEQARQELARCNRWAVKRGIRPFRELEACNSGDIHLPVSFRLAPELVAFVNRVTQPLFEQTPEQVPYEPLVCGRPWATGSVSFLLALKALDRASSLSEEELVARSILHWVGGATPLMVAHGDGMRELYRPARYSDIAILTRYRSSIPALTLTLQQYGIPYVIHAGTGFFQAPEVQDVHFLLRFLLNERDDLALAIALRSPLFALEDEQLLTISLTEGEGLWQKLCRRAEAPDAEPQLRHAAETLRLLRLLAARASVAELVRTLGERTQWLLRMRHQARWAQIQANLQKLFEIARDFQSQGFRTLADFVDELEALIEAEVPEPEAVLPSSLDAVNVLTIHAAKGLEFPVVVLYRTAEAKDRGALDDALLVDEEFGLVRRLQRWDADSGVWLPVSTPAFALAQQRVRDRHRAEEQRVLYVGLTRARDHLVLSGTLQWSKDRRTYRPPRGLLGFVLQALSVASDVLAHTPFIEISEEVEYALDGQRGSRSLTLRIPIVREVPAALPPPQPPRLQRPPIVLTEPVPVRWSQERLSATHYALFRHSPESFLRRLLLGFPATPEELLQGAMVPSDSERELPEPLVLGYLLHELLAHVQLWTTESGTPLPEQLAKLTRSLLLRTPYANAMAAEAWLRQRAHAIVSTPLVQRSWAAFRRALREYALTVPLGDNFLTGTLDVLLPTDEGWEIWDWKMGTIQSRQDCSRLAQWYEPQLQVYAYLVFRRFPEQTRLRVRLLFVEAAQPQISDEAWTWSACWERTAILALEPEFHRVAAQLFFLGEVETTALGTDENPDANPQAGR